MLVKRLLWLSVLGAAMWATSSLASAADPFTAGVLSCAAESDRGRRLDCYDRAVANFTAALSSGGRDSAAGAAPAGNAEVGTRPVAATSASAAAAPASAPSSPTTGSAPGGASGTGASSAAATSNPGATAGQPASSPPKHIAARIVSIDHFPDYVVVHLDNQQTWKQVSDSPGGATLRTGDSITIDRQIGSYWLAGAKGEAVQVKLQTSKP
jgi:hypothetical protein